MLMVLFGSLILLDSCKDNNNDNPAIAAPTISVAPTNVSGLPGSDVTIAVVTAAGSGASIASVTVTDGTNSDNVNGSSYAYSIASDASEGSQITLTFTATDNQSPAKTATATATVTVGEAPAQTITLKEPGDKSGLASFDGYDASTKTYTMVKKNTYILDGFIFVNDGQTLNIEAGTLIYGLPGQGAGASALIVARGGKIMAEGTADAPIIMTGKADDLNGSVPDDANQLWGGLIILGKATTSNLAENNDKSIEGIPESEERGHYGGSDDADNSGEIKYISVRHGGSVIGADNEINGISLGAVGSGTVIDHVEVFSNFDDGIEFFGGDPTVTNVVLSYIGDDGLDQDEGFHGKIQNAIVWETGDTRESSDPRGSEDDGGVGANEPEKPFATPTISNVTLYFDGPEVKNYSPGDNQTIYMRDGWGGKWYNSIFYNFPSGIDMERRTDQINSVDSKPASCYDQWLAVADGGYGNLKIENNVIFTGDDMSRTNDATGFANLFVLSDETDATKEADVESYLMQNNVIVDPGFGTGAAKFTPCRRSKDRFTHRVA